MNEISTPHPKFFLSIKKIHELSGPQMTLVNKNGLN